jgi:hypothetical protein
LGTLIFNSGSRAGLSSRTLSLTAWARIWPSRRITIWIERGESGLRRRPFSSSARPPAAAIFLSASLSLDSLPRKRRQSTSLILATGVVPKDGRMYFLSLQR